MLEVVEKQVADYESESNKREWADIWALWEIAEALAFLFAGDEDDRWMSKFLFLIICIDGFFMTRSIGSDNTRIDIGSDPEKLTGLIGLVGVLFVDACKRMQVAGHLIPGGPIKNVGLVLGCMIGLADIWEEMLGEELDECQWKANIIGFARRQQIKLMELRQKVQEMSINDADNEREEQAAGLDFKKRVTKYKKNHFDGQWRGFDKYKLVDLSEAEKKKLGKFPSFGSGSEFDDSDKDDEAYVSNDLYVY